MNIHLYNSVGSDSIHTIPKQNLVQDELEFKRVYLKLV